MHLHNGTTHSCHHVRAHRVPLSEIQKNPAALHNSRQKCNTRQVMLDGQRPKECQYCWNVEDVGQLSDRVYKSAESWANPHFKDVLKEGVGQKTLPTYLEVSFSNSCNFRCMYCYPIFSTSWTAEVKEFGPYRTRTRPTDLKWAKKDNMVSYAADEQNPYVDAFWQWWPELRQSLKTFRVTGGEPLMAKDTWRVLDSLKETPQPDLDFAINSNLGLGRKVIEKLVDKINGLEGNVKSFTLYTSVDTYGEKAEYIRFGLNFEKFFDNVHYILSHSNHPIKLSFMITVNVLSLSQLEQLLMKIRDIRAQYPRHQIGLDTPLFAQSRLSRHQYLAAVFCEVSAENCRKNARRRWVL